MSLMIASVQVDECALATYVIWCVERHLRHCVTSNVHDDNIINSDNSSSVCTYSNIFKARYHSCQSVMTFSPLVFVVDIVVYMYQKVVQDTTVYPVPLQGCVCVVSHYSEPNTTTHYTEILPAPCYSVRKLNKMYTILHDSTVDIQLATCSVLTALPSLMAPPYRQAKLSRNQIGASQRQTLLTSKHYSMFTYELTHAALLTEGLRTDCRALTEL
jgi:hypothetical protein